METKLFDEQLASKYARNILDNGGFEIWQRGTSLIGNGYICDRWEALASGGSPVYTVSRDNTTIRPDSEYSLKLNLTNAGGTSYVWIRQQIEKYKDYRGRTLSVSCWVYTTGANKMRLRISDSAGSSYSSYHGGTGWEKLTVTRAIDLASTSLAVWLIYDQNVTAEIFYLDDAMFVLGSQPVDYVPLSSAEEWDRCLRYYEVAKAEISAFNGDASWHDLSTTIIYNAKKVSIPTVSLNPGGIAFVGDADTSGFLLRRYTAPGTYATWVGTYTAEVI